MKIISLLLIILFPFIIIFFLFINIPFSTIVISPLSYACNLDSDCHESRMCGNTSCSARRNIEFRYGSTILCKENYKLDKMYYQKCVCDQKTYTCGWKITMQGNIRVIIYNLSVDIKLFFDKLVNK
jgi:hypothetical protein